MSWKDKFPQKGRYWETPNGILYQGHVLEALRQLPDESVDCIVTSPPYWQLRDYGQETNTIWGGDPNCEHEWEIEVKNIQEDKTGKYNGDWDRPSRKEYSKAGNIKKCPVCGKVFKARIGQKFCSTKCLNTLSNELRSSLPEKSSFCKKCGCYDDKTEILTDKGWKLFKDLDDSDLVATLENGYLAFRKPVRYFEYFYDGDMIEFTGQNIDLLVTPTHNMWIKRRGKCCFEFIPAEKIRLNYKIKRDLKWKGKNVEYFEMPIVKDKRNRKNLNKPIKISMKDWLKFLGIYLAEGGCHFRTHKGHYEYLVYISQKNKIKEVKEILDKLPFKYSYKNNEFLIYNKSLYYYLIKLGKTYNKQVPREIQHLSPHLLKELLKGYLIGDGHIRKDGRIEASTTSINLADDLQEIGLKLGYAVTISEHKENRKNRKLLYRIAFLNNQKETGIWHIQRVKYRGKVYCVEVPSHILLVRRNKKVCWSGNSWYGQLGLEPTLDLFIEHLSSITKELKRVLKPTGVMFWNHDTNMENKCNTIQNWRLIIKMVDEQGWILRGKVPIIWHKPNSMPSSLKDAFTHCYEPIFMLVKNKKYWLDLDSVRMPHKESSLKRDAIGYKTSPMKGRYQVPWEERNGTRDQSFLHPLGKNPGDVWKHTEKFKIKVEDENGVIFGAGNIPFWMVEQIYKVLLQIESDKEDKKDLWTISTQPFPEAHFATFPERLIEPMIKVGCPAQICCACGKARVRITKTIGKERVSWEVDKKARVFGKPGEPAMRNINITTDWTDCGCKLENKWEPGIVLDPFMGSGTVAVAAEKLGRRWIGIEINPGYCEMVKKRILKILNGRLFI